MRAGYELSAIPGNGVPAVNETDMVLALRGKTAGVQVTECDECSGKKVTGARPHEVREAHSDQELPDPP